ncbi:eukaryotic elongation factor 2 kinase-like [Physella acuta]|uniref:eukaryotic elongation factor 2 kinase-like n=1 Tax=Physella acuta TaxID=109671 RepID=UPI0027DCFBB9|nr:eukaryotic elongation factor 2 kinase-like [Physella acuta]
MGQAMSSETLSISGGDGYKYWVGLTMKPFARGCKKTMYKGVLLGQGPRQWEKVVAKAFTDIPGTKEFWVHELNKSNVTKQLAAKFVEDFPSLCSIRVVLPGIVQMDKVSNVNKWLAGRKGKRSLDQDEWISIEELIPGDLVRFCPWSLENHTEEHAESEHLQAFSHYTYKFTNGTLVACDFQGVCERTGSATRYIFTDSTIHSSCKTYGLFDKGLFGITEFFKLHKCSRICRDWPKPTPLTPPPTFDEACRIQLTPSTEFENIVFPASYLAQTNNAVSRTDSGRRRHASDHVTRMYAIRTDEPIQSYRGNVRRRRSNSFCENAPNLTTVASVLPPAVATTADTDPPSYDAVIAMQNSRDVDRAGRARNDTRSHAILSSSSSCPILDTDQYRIENEAVLNTISRSQTSEGPSLRRQDATEDIRDRSWSDNVTNSNLLHRRLMNPTRNATHAPEYSSLVGELRPLRIPTAPSIEDDRLSAT